MIELLYDEKALPEIKEAFPHVKVEDASDSIHTGRVEIELPDEDRDAFYKHSIRKGYHGLLLGFGMMQTGINPEDITTIKRWVNELKAERESA